MSKSMFFITFIDFFLKGMVKFKISSQWNGISMPIHAFHCLCTAHISFAPSETLYYSGHLADSPQCPMVSPQMSVTARRTFPCCNTYL